MDLFRLTMRIFTKPTCPVLSITTGLPNHVMVMQQREHTMPLCLDRVYRCCTKEVVFPNNDQIVMYPNNSLIVTMGSFHPNNGLEDGPSTAYIAAVRCSSEVSQTLCFANWYRLHLPSLHHRHRQDFTSSPKFISYHQSPFFFDVLLPEHLVSINYDDNTTSCREQSHQIHDSVVEYNP